MGTVVAFEASKMMTNNIATTKRSASTKLPKLCFAGAPVRSLAAAKIPPVENKTHHEETEFLSFKSLWHEWIQKIEKLHGISCIGAACGNQTLGLKQYAVQCGSKFVPRGIMLIILHGSFWLHRDCTFSVLQLFHTLPETNIAPENQWWKMIFFLGMAILMGYVFCFWRVNFHTCIWVVTDKGRWIWHFCLFNVFHLCGRLDFDIPGVWFNSAKQDAQLWTMTL